MKKSKIGIFFCMLLCALMFTGCTLQFTPQENGGTTPVIPNGSLTSTLPDAATASQIVETYLDAVVSIVVEKNGSGSLGSGVGVHEGGYIATNYHVISSLVESSGYSLFVVHNESDQSHTAELLWYSKEIDMAVIKCSCTTLPYVTMADRSIYTNSPFDPLEPVIAIGTPLDLSLQNSYTLGFINGTDRMSYTTNDYGQLDNVYESLIQHQSPITHGNSGGPLFDMNGYLIGLNTLGREDAVLYFATPIFPLTKILDDIVYAKEHNTQYVDETALISGIDFYYTMVNNTYNFTNKGFLIKSVKASSKFNTILKANDVVTALSFNGKNYTINCRNDFMYAIYDAGTGAVGTVTYTRNGVANTVNVTL